MTSVRFQRPSASGGSQNRAVVGEEHTSWVEVGESIQPVPIRRKRLLHAVKCRAAGQLLGREVGSEGVCLTGKDYCAVALPEDQRLMPLGVPGRRDDPDSGPDVRSQKIWIEEVYLTWALSVLLGRVGSRAAQWIWTLLRLL
ncbi:hypothetical protein FHX80_113155 [Streptomyces brevispora]|uniref:Uncharacterized protein n=1 Tax=Streptomyces brevispora TaxID=887462 RepID=A0A561UZB2_9ACTN|nr:hypothetical protein FHX80_113155 [Streptomyces brevispora]